MAEIYHGRLSVTIPALETFQNTHFAKLGINHRILLVARYLRGVAQDYFREYGREIPSESDLTERIPFQTLKEIRQITADAANDPAFVELVKNARFRTFLNSQVQKSLRGYTNPEAAAALFKLFGLDTVWKRNESLEPVNQYLFAHEPLASNTVKARIASYGFKAEEVLSPVDQLLPDLTIYHGTPSDVAFRSILSQGALPSQSDRYVGSGLYAASKESIPFLTRNYAGGDEKRIVKFKVSSNTRAVDISKGKGKELFEEYLRRHPDLKEKRGFSRAANSFANKFDIELLRYQFIDTKDRPFVVKNSRILSSPEGHLAKIVSLGEIMNLATRVSDLNTLSAFNDAFGYSGLLPEDAEVVLSNINAPPELVSRIKTLLHNHARNLHPYDINAAERVLLLISELDHLATNGLALERQKFLAAKIVDIVISINLPKRPYTVKESAAREVIAFWNSIPQTISPAAFKAVESEFVQRFNMAVKLQNSLQGFGRLAKNLMLDAKSVTTLKTGGAIAACFVLNNARDVDQSAQKTAGNLACGLATGLYYFTQSFMPTIVRRMYLLNGPQMVPAIAEKFSVEQLRERRKQGSDCLKRKLFEGLN